MVNKERTAVETAMFDIIKNWMRIPALRRQALENLDRYLTMLYGTNYMDIDKMKLLAALSESVAVKYLEANDMINSQQVPLVYRNIYDDLDLTEAERKRLGLDQDNDVDIAGKIGVLVHIDTLKTTFSKLCMH